MLTALIVCLLALLPHCSGTDREGITFAVGGAPAELAFWEQLVQDFQDTTGIPVTLLRQPTDTDQRRQGLVIPLEAGKSDPDVFLMDVVWIAQFAASGWLQPLDADLARSPLRLDMFFANVVRLADRYRGRLIALPVYIDAGVLYYRKDLLLQLGISKPPQTWSQLATEARQVQQRQRADHPDFYGFVWQGAQYEGLICNFLEFAASNRGGIVFRNGHILLNTPENRTAVRFMRDLIGRYRVSPPSTYTEMREEETRLTFQHGNALFERNWPYAWPLHQSDRSAVRGRTGVAPLPHFPGGESVSALGGWHIGISAYSDHQAMSWRLVRFILSSQTQKRLTLRLGWNPARKALYDDPQVLAAMPHLQRLRAIFTHARPRPTLPYYTQLSEVLQRHLNAILAGKTGVGAGLAAAQTEAQELVDRYAQR